MVVLRLLLAALSLFLAAGSSAQTMSVAAAHPQVCDDGDELSFFLDVPAASSCVDRAAQNTPASSPQPAAKPKGGAKVPVDKNGNPIPIERQQPQRILGFMPNFRTVSGGAAAHPPGFKYNFIIASRQATDYSSFIFLGLTSLISEGTNEHPSLGKGVEGFGQYTWRGFLDKTDNTYLSAWILSTMLREDTRYYALGTGHSIAFRSLYVISQQGVSRTWSGHKTPNFAGLGAKALTQYVSRYYYPPSAATFGVLATKFGYSVMRDVAFASVREFYPDINAYYLRKHQQKAARLAAKRAAAAHTSVPQNSAAPVK
jgi:hypothetical protein